MTMSNASPSTSAAPQPDARDRERARGERGLRSSLAASASYRGQSPKPPHRRRPMLALLAVLLIVGGAALAGVLAVRLDSRAEVIVLGRDVAAGEQITADMLDSTPVASEGLHLVPVDEADAVLGTYARVAIAQGQLLDTSMLTTAEPIGEGKAMVGVPLANGRVPSGLRSGDVVRVVRIGDGIGTVTPLAVALVLDTDRIEDEGLAGEGESSQRGTLLVTTEAADAVVDAAGNDQLGLALIERGVPIDEAPLDSLRGPG
jgi:hypothetical protein